MSIRKAEAAAAAAAAAMVGAPPSETAAAVACRVRVGARTPRPWPNRSKWQGFTTMWKQAEEAVEAWPMVGAQHARASGPATRVPLLPLAATHPAVAVPMVATAEDAEGFVMPPLLAVAVR